MPLIDRLKGALRGESPDPALLAEAREKAAQDHEQARAAVEAATDERSLLAAEGQERRSRLALLAAVRAEIAARTAAVERLHGEREQAEAEAAKATAALVQRVQQGLSTLLIALDDAREVEAKLARHVGHQRAHAIAGQWFPYHLTPLAVAWGEFHRRFNGPLVGRDGDGSPAA